MHMTATKVADVYCTLQIGVKPAFSLSIILLKLMELINPIHWSVVNVNQRNLVSRDLDRFQTYSLNFFSI